MEQVLYYNGTIITMENREAPYAEAVLTENGRIKDRGAFPGSGRRRERMRAWRTCRAPP